MEKSPEKELGWQSEGGTAPGSSVLALVQAAAAASRQNLSWRSDW